MKTGEIAHYTGQSTSEINRLLGLGQAAVYADPVYKDWVKSLDVTLLHQTLPMARAIYERLLPSFTARLKDSYGIDSSPMSAFTLGNWLVGFLQYPDQINQLAHLHRRIPKAALEEGLPDILQALEELPNGKREWQKAMTVLMLPLLSAN